MKLPGKKGLSVELSLSREIVVRGESVYFTVKITNNSSERLLEILSLKARNRALILTAATADTTVSAHGQSGGQRAGFHSHGPKEPDTVDLDPGKSMTEAGDMLYWMGELPPGNYTVTATYQSSGTTADSPAVNLRILAATPVALTTARHGARVSDSHMTGAWIHKTADSDPEKGKFIIFYQEQNAIRPRVPVHGVRLAVVPENVTPFASTWEGVVERTHVVWTKSKGHLACVPIDPETGKVNPLIDIKTPFAAESLASPLSLEDGGLLIPIADTKRSAAALMYLGPDGALKVIKLPLDNQMPFGPNVWLWWFGAKLHVAWSKPGSREIRYTRLPLDDLDAGFFPTISLQVDDPVIWLDGYLDQDSADVRAKPDDTPPPPDPVLWAVMLTKNSLSFARVNAITTLAQPSFSISTETFGLMQVISSVVFAQSELAVILRNERGTLYYISTAAREIRSLEKVAGVPITAAQLPTLIAADKASVQPWVYVRYVETLQRRIAYAKVHPEDVDDVIHEH